MCVCVCTVLGNGENKQAEEFAMRANVCRTLPVE